MHNWAHRCIGKIIDVIKNAPTPIYTLNDDLIDTGQHYKSFFTLNWILSYKICVHKLGILT